MAGQSNNREWWHRGELVPVPNGDYITGFVIPDAVMDRALVENCYIEFLEPVAGGGSNNCVIILMFAAPTTELTSEVMAPGTTGVVLRFHIPDPSDPRLEGVLSCRTIQFTGDHIRSAFTVQLPIAPGSTVRSIVSAVDDHHMLPACFSPAGQFVAGCREFTSSWLLRLYERGILVLGGPMVLDWVTNIFNYYYSMNLRGRRPAPVARPVGRVMFLNANHVPLTIGNIAYAPAPGPMRKLITATALFKAALGAVIDCETEGKTETETEEAIERLLILQAAAQRAEAEAVAAQRANARARRAARRVPRANAAKRANARAKRAAKRGGA